MELNLSPKQVQALSPQMILSMEILQMGTQELLEHIEAVLQENPVLEADGGYAGCDEPRDLFCKLEWLETTDPQNRYYHQQDHGPEADSSYLDSVSEERGESLYDHVCAQLWTMKLEPQFASCVEFLAGCLDQNGWLDEDVSLLAREFGRALAEMERALSVVQSLEPAGIGARNLSECLCLQLKRRVPVDRLALSIAADYLEPLARNRFGFIAQLLGASVEDVRRAAGVIRSLDPRPGIAFTSSERPSYVTPDVIVSTFADHFELTSNERFLPVLNISPYYTRLLEESDEETVRDYLRGKVQQAKWTISTIEQRRNTLLACTQCIVELQKDFFRKGSGNLVPMSLTDVARRVGVHESTVSRAVRGKYLQCSMGTYPLSHFFVRRLGCAAEGISSSPDAAKALLKKLIAQEDKHKPLSDQKLCEQMAAQGCMLSRRTVAKYRDELNIPGMAGRRN